MRITFIQGDYSRTPRGGPRVVYEYASRLAERGHDLNVVHPRKLPIKPPKLSQRARRRAGEIRDLIFTPTVTWQPIHRRVNLDYVRDLSPGYIPEADAIFATAWHTAPPVLEYPCEKGEKFYLIQHYETWAGPQEQVNATWRAPLHKIVVAEWLREVGLSLGCTDVVCIPNGIDQNRFRLVQPIENRPSSVAFLYSSADWKGADDALQALAIVRKRHPHFDAIAFGIEKRPRGIPGWIEYVQNPAQGDLVEKIYNRSAVFLCSSWSEGFGLASAEAMTCGCALVTTDCGGNRSYAVHGVTALVSRPKNPQELADNLLRVLNDDVLRVCIAAAGQRKIQEFDWERSTDSLEQYISEQIRSAVSKRSR